MSTSPTVAIRQESFDPVLAEQATLCLEVSKDRFRFAMLDKAGLCVWLEEFMFPSLLNDRAPHDMLPAIFEQHQILSHGSWRQVLVSVNSPSFTLIPKPLFRKEYAGSYLAFMRGSELMPHEFPTAYLHSHDDCYVVFNMDHQLSDFFSAQYPLQQLSFVHQTSTILEASRFSDNAKTGLRPVMTLCFENEFVTVMLRQNGQLKYGNRFGYKNPDDLVYYLLYLIAELQFTPDVLTAFLFGELTPFSETYSRLAAFFPNLRFGHSPSPLRLAPGFDELPDHRYLSLYGLCLISQ
ncbi:DUF3822 family protein [Arsenicibacter rosenii]|uniref:DUF3822 domain-containing protein n=1 Tax=Arsenicibacter rosenii TaxID=1750698 RepID=A0A1S2VL61_9BACT|nr:DUF3822 family protein [Arsenicibacter rosenii]OIN59507.1 hypothetical protein BLX24_09055 [Arsenicibacter rosenii]